MTLRFSVLLKNFKELADPRNLLFAPSEIAFYLKDKKQFKREYQGDYPIRTLPVLFERKKKSVFDKKVKRKMDFCRVPILNLKNREVKILDFSDEICEIKWDKGNKLFCHINKGEYK
jgi:hypothetical protein